MAHTEGSRALAAILRPPKPKHMSQAELARKLEVSAQAVSDWLRGDTLPRPELMAKIEDILGVPMRAWTVEIPEGEPQNNKPPEAP